MTEIPMGPIRARQLFEHALHKRRRGESLEELEQRAIDIVRSRDRDAWKAFVDELGSPESIAEMWGDENECGHPVNRGRRLSAREAREIAQLARILPLAEIARRYGVSVTTVRRAVLRHLPPAAHPAGLQEAVA